MYFYPIKTDLTSDHEVKYSYHFPVERYNSTDTREITLLYSHTFSTQTSNTIYSMFVEISMNQCIETVRKSNQNTSHIPFTNR